MKHGDFTQLADSYSKYRPGYSDKVLDAIVGLLPQSPGKSIFADVGAGTGIWTRLVAQRGFQQVYAIEPNSEMRKHGILDSQDMAIEWIEGNGESVGLPNNSLDFLSMASSFHWVDFKKGIEEFTRVLKPGGLFVALWNPRLTKETSILREIQEFLEQLKPNMKRVSSGNSKFTENLYDNIWATDKFSDIVYLEAKHKIWMSKETYIGVWKSVNDVRVQLGEEKFDEFLKFIDTTIGNKEGLETFYLTRAWCNIIK